MRWEAREWYLRVFNYSTEYFGVIQFEMNRRGGASFLHLTFISHQMAEQAKKHIQRLMKRRIIGEFGEDDKAVRATWARFLQPQHQTWIGSKPGLCGSCVALMTTKTTIPLSLPHLPHHMGKLVPRQIQAGE